MAIEPDTRLSISGIDRPLEEAFARERVPIPDGSYTLDEFTEHLRDGWVPFVRCHKCGWFDACPFPHRQELDPDLGCAIQCGVTAKIMSNCLTAWWPRLQGMDSAGIQTFVDALFHFVQFVHDAHEHLGLLFDMWDPEWWGPDMAPQIMAAPLFLRDDLTELAGHLKQLPGVRLVQSLVVFVEGQAEARFLQVLRDRRQLASVVRVEVLGGKSNATPDRIPLDMLHRQGYQISLQLDKDGSKKKSYRKLKERVHGIGGSVFIFERDFESGFPAPLLGAALRELGINVDADWLKGRLEGGATGIVREIEQKHGVRIDKVALAELLAALFDDNWSDVVREWKDSEIVRWTMLLSAGRRIDGDQG